MTYTIVANAPLEDNPAWQEVNKQVGATLQMQLTPFADYTARLQTVLAGGDLPDVVYMPAIQPEQAQLLQAKFADLTPYLSGDAVKEYPNLANLPTTSWKHTVFNNAIYAVPTAYMRFFWMLWNRQDMLEQAGIAQPTTADEFKRALVSLTDTQAARGASRATSTTRSTSGVQAAACTPRCSVRPISGATAAVNSRVPGKPNSSKPRSDSHATCTRLVCTTRIA